MIIVMGLPGAGKSTVLSELKKMRPEYTIANYGDLMFEIEKKEGWVTQRDEMRKLSIEKQKKAQSLVAERLATEKGKFILDTHCSVNTPRGYYPGLPISLLKGISVELLIYVTATVEEIERRRKSDTTRVRDVDNIAEHDSINRSYLATYSAFTAAPAAIVYNREGELKKTIEHVNTLVP